MANMTARVQRKRINLDHLKEGIVRVGWFDNMFYDEGTPVAAVARWNEYGTPSAKYPIPPRPFVRPVVHGKQHLIQEKLRDLYLTAVRNNTNTMTALEIFGEYVSELIRRQIDLTVSPANAPITLKGGWLRSKSGKPFYVHPKRGSHPLKDTGVLQDSVSYQAEEKM